MRRRRLQYVIRPIVDSAFRTGDDSTNLWQEVISMRHLLIALAFVSGMLCTEHAGASEAEDFHARIAELQGRIYLANTARAGLSGLSETNTSLD